MGSNSDQSTNRGLKSTTKYYEHCAVPENIHTPPTEGIGIPCG